MHKEGTPQEYEDMRYKNYWSRCILLKVALHKVILHEKSSYFKVIKINSDDWGTI